MQKLVAAAVVAAAVSIVAAPSAFGQIPGTSPQSAQNMRLVTNFDDGGTYRTGTDMAFWGDRLLLGSLDQGTAGVNATPPGGFRVMDISDPDTPSEIAQFTCPGDQSDVSVWENIVVLSVDKPTFDKCTPEASSPAAGSWEGVRIIDLAKVPADGTVAGSIAAIDKTLPTDCGSHTNTIYPDLENDRLLVYVLSYPLAGRYNPAGAMAVCNALMHKKISVVEVPLSNPADAKVLENQPSTGNTIGCHDVTVFMEKKIAAAACLTETQIWDLSVSEQNPHGPERPRIIATIQEPGVNIHHSTVFSNDGNTLVIGDELGGAAASPGCLTDEDGPQYEQGGLFFYDVSDPDDPKPSGSYKLPRDVASEFCTAHLFNVVPRRDERDVLVSSWYSGSTSVIDFTNPGAPREVAHWIPPKTVTPDEQTAEAAAWASYWYNGRVYANNFDEDVNSVEPQSRGLDVFKLELTGADASLIDGAVELPHLNPQLQLPLPDPDPTVTWPGKSGSTPAADRRRGGAKG